MKPHVTFRSTRFNDAAPRLHPINAGIRGENVALWLVEALRARGAKIESAPGPEDFGWYVRFTVDETRHFFVLTQGDASDEWAGWVERAGLLSLFLTSRRHAVTARALQLLRDVFVSAPDIHDVHFSGVFDLSR